MAEREQGGAAARRNGRSRNESPEEQRSERARIEDTEEHEVFRSEYLASAGRFIEEAGVWVRSWYPVVSHTSDLLIQVGKFAPSKDKSKGNCPAPLLRVATSCRGAGDGLSSVALCLKGASGMCHAISTGIKCLNHSNGVRAGLDEASRPQKIFITSIPQLKKVLDRRALTGSSVVLDVGPQVTIALAVKIDKHLQRAGDEEHSLIRDGSNMKLRLAQHARISSLFRVDPLPEGLLQFLDQQAPPPPAPTHQPPPSTQQPPPPPLRRHHVHRAAGNTQPEQAPAPPAGGGTSSST